MTRQTAHLDALLNDLTKQFIDAGHVCPPENGALFWAFYKTPNVKDRNVRLLSLFRQAAEETDQAFGSLRELGQYGEFKPHLYNKVISKAFCQAFARRVTGETITIAVDSGQPDDFFMTVEMPILMENRGLRSVCRIMPHPADPDALQGAFRMKVYGSIEGWLYEQRQQWFSASLNRTQRDMALNRLDGTPFDPDQSCAVREMVLLDQRMNSPRPYHEDHERLKNLDRQLWQKGQAWLKSQGLLKLM